MTRKSDQIMVTIQCLTYNQASYIRKCLDGFVMQKTNFRYEVIVHDDASTDGTADIVKEYAEKYPDIIIPIIETDNQYSKGDGSLNKIMDEHTHGKYVAICEGDDYWVDPLKLQKQVEYLEKNSECVLTYTNILVEKNGKLLRDNVLRYSGECLNLLIERGNFVATCSVCYRKSADVGLKEFIDSFPFKLKMGDKPHWIYLASKGTFKYFEDITSVYRVLINSSSHPDDFKKMMDFLSNGELITIYSNKWFNSGLREKDIHKNYAASKIIFSTRYGWRDCISTALCYFYKYPELLLRKYLIARFVYRFLGGK